MGRTPGRMPQKVQTNQIMRIISVACLALALLLFLISFGTTFWGRTNLHKVERDEHIGLWRYCVSTAGAGGDKCDDFVDRGNYGDWLKSTQSFMTLALFAIVASLGIFGVYVFIDDFQEDMRMFACCMASGGIAGLFLMIGVTAFAVEYQEYFKTRDNYTPEMCRLGWSWYLALVCTISTFAAPILLLTDKILRSGDDD